MKRSDLFHALHPGGKAFAYQQEWSEDRSKFKLGIKARQIGITTSEAIDDFIECLFWKESERNPSPPVVVFCSPSQRQSGRLMDYIQRAKTRFERSLETTITFKREREDRIIFDNGAELFSLPNNPRTIEGIDISKGVIDEMGNFVGREDYQVYESMMGSLAAKGGGLTLFGAPRGRRGLFWELADPYGEYVNRFSSHKFQWTVRADEDAKYKASVEDHKNKMSPLAFAENYECEFVDETVVVFPYDLLDRQTQEIKIWSLTVKPDTNFPVFMGIDFGKQTSKTALTLVEDEGKKTYARWQAVSTESYDKQFTWICESIEHFKPIAVMVDEGGPGLPLLDTLKAKFGDRIKGVTLTNSVKEKMLLGTRNMMEEGRLIIPNDTLYKDLFIQLHGIEKEVLDSGRNKYSGKHTQSDWFDDRAWSLFLACSQLGASDFEFRIVDYTPKDEKLSDYERWRRE